MKILNTLRLAWRSNVLFVEEAKRTFFRRNEKLINNPKWDYLFRASHKQGVEVVFFDSEKDLVYLKKDDILVVSSDDYGNFIEILVDKVYMLPPQLNDNFCVFDMGMNRGYVSLFFANNPNCVKVIGFELDKGVYEKALQNFTLNKSLSNKIKSYNFGLWNADEELDILTSETDTYTSIMSCVDESSHLTTKMQTQKCKKTVKASVKKSSNILAPMFQEINEKKILKIDIEGAEYIVFEDLYNHNLLQQFDMIVGEVHNGLAGIEKYLDDFVCVNKNHLSDLLITFCYINKRIV